MSEGSVLKRVSAIAERQGGAAPEDRTSPRKQKGKGHHDNKKLLKIGSGKWV